MFASMQSLPPQIVLSEYVDERSANYSLADKKRMVDQNLTMASYSNHYLTACGEASRIRESLFKEGKADTKQMVSHDT